MKTFRAAALVCALTLSLGVSTLAPSLLAQETAASSAPVAAAAGPLPAAEAQPGVDPTLALKVLNAASPISPEASQVAGIIQAVIDVVGPKFAKFISVFAVVTMVMGTLRLFFKPLFMTLEIALARDPAKLAKLRSFTGGPIYKVIAFVLDVGASIKVPVVVVAKQKQ